MASNLRMSEAAVNAEADALAALVDNGFLRIYDGTQPASPDVPVTTQVLLAELRLGIPAFAAASNGIIVANPITSDISADASGTASWFRVFGADGTSPVWDGSVGLAGCNLNLTSVDISAGDDVQVLSLVHTIPK